MATSESSSLTSNKKQNSSGNGNDNNDTENRHPQRVFVVANNFNFMSSD